MTDQATAMQQVLAADRTGRGRGWLWGAGALLLAAGAAGWLWLGSGSAVTYVTDPVTRASLRAEVTATGTVQPTTEVEVSSELSGTLAVVEVNFNDPVTVGQPLARLDDAKLRAQVALSEAGLAQARAKVAEAEATLQQTSADLARVQELVRRGQKSQTELETAEASEKRAQAAVDSAKANLTIAEASLALDRTDLAKAVIRSPIKGIVLDRAAEPGQIVASSLSAPVLFTLAEDLARMELQVDIDEADIGRVKMGDQAAFTVDAYGGRSFPAMITQLRYAPEDTDGVVTYKGVLSVDNAEGLLRPGMTATANVVVAEAVDVLTVANAALRYAPATDSSESSSGSGSGLLGMLMPRRPDATGRSATDGSAVWVLRDGAPVSVAVETGETDGTRTEIRQGDLAEGDLVITDEQAAE